MIADDALPPGQDETTNRADWMPPTGGNSEDHKANALRDAMDVNAWAALDIPPEPRLLGHLVTPTTRLFLVGSTGIGKTLLAYELAAGMASGRGFLSWTCDRPSRWLIIDGEMPTPLIKRRCADVMLHRHAPRDVIDVDAEDADPGCAPVRLAAE